jgi:hypothetical protein
MNNFLHYHIKIMASVCAAFHANPSINPRTGRIIQFQKGKYNELVDECGPPPGLSMGPSAAVSTDKDAPPEFMPPAPLVCEGYWIDERAVQNHEEELERMTKLRPGLTVYVHPETVRDLRAKIKKLKKIGIYVPVASDRPWPGKKAWVGKIATIQAYLQSRYNWTFRHYNSREHEIDPRQSELVPYGGPSYSRITHELIGSNEYVDSGMCWPSDYVKHYIADHNVMPTEKFYNYVNERYLTLPAKYRRGHYTLDTWDPRVPTPDQIDPATGFIRLDAIPSTKI